jgi:broad specificity phosphatase PhoE
VTTPAVLALVRHGESTWLAEGRFQGRGDVPLTDTGRRQATAIGARLAAPAAAPSVPVPDTPPLAIWHSPLRRATETAQAIHEAREADAPLRPLDTLAELSQGEWEGLTLDEVRAHYPRQLQGWLDDPIHHHAPGGESLPAAFERAQRTLRTILATPIAGESSAERTPGATPRSAPARSVDPVLGYERSRGYVRPPAWAIVVAHDGILRCLALSLLGIGLEHFWSLPFALAGVSVLDTATGAPRLLAHNLDEHVTALTRR